MIIGLIALITVSSAVMLGGDSCAATEQTKLVPADLASGDQLGSSVAIFGNVVLVGARYDDNENGKTAGAAYAFRLDEQGQWVEEDKLLANDGQNGDGFGSAVALQETFAVVGAPFEDSPNLSGSAYVFRPAPNRSWMQEQKLVASDLAADDRFGSSVAAIENVIVVGAIFDDHVVENAGSAYVFEFVKARNEWVETAKLVSPRPGTFDYFGGGVAISDDLIVVGASGDDGAATDAGAVFIYRRAVGKSVWELAQILTASDASEEGFFGIPVDIDKETIVAGAVGQGGAGLLSGAAYVFEYDPKQQQWIETQKLIPSDGDVKDLFGVSVSIADRVILVGADHKDFDFPSAGSAYVYHRRVPQGLWTEVVKFVASDPEVTAVFGQAVAVHDGVGIAGAPGKDDVGPFGNSGAVYVLPGLTDCNENGTLDICDIANGTSADTNGNGIPDECEPPPCPWDLDGNNDIGVGDLLILLGAWGPCPPKGDCPADFDGSGDVGVSDFLELLGNWGPCP